MHTKCWTVHNTHMHMGQSTHKQKYQMKFNWKLHEEGRLQRLRRNESKAIHYSMHLRTSMPPLMPWSIWLFYNESEPRQKFNRVSKCFISFLCLLHRHTYIEKETHARNILSMRRRDERVYTLYANKVRWFAVSYILNYKCSHCKQVVCIFLFQLGISLYVFL